MNYPVKVLRIFEYSLSCLFLIFSFYCSFKMMYGDPHGIIFGIWLWAISFSVLFFFCGIMLKYSLLAKVFSHSVLVVVTVALTLIVFYPDMLPFEWPITSRLTRSLHSLDSKIATRLAAHYRSVMFIQYLVLVHDFW